MRYLTLAADYQEPSVRDEGSGSVSVDNLGIPAELRDDLLAWNARYQAIVPMSMEERRAGPWAALIDELDRSGLKLAERLGAAVGDDAKVAYYSEGRLRRLP